MRKAKMRIGELVEIPNYCFDERRRGWNGWIFKHAVIRGIATGQKTGRQIAIVETYDHNYGQELRNIRGEIAGYTDRKTVIKKVYADNVFAVDKVSIDHNQEYINEHRREVMCTHTYSSDTEFDIDMGFINDPYENEKHGEVIRPQEV